MCARYLQVLGNVLDLPLVSNTTNSLGQTVQVRQYTTGSLIDVVLDTAGKILSATVEQ
jgi:hypothetical protein